MSVAEFRAGESWSARRFWWLAAAVIALALWARLANLREVFGPWGTELLPSDSHYYVRFALLQLRAFPRFVQADPYVGFPEGAAIYWPPVSAWLVALCALLGGKGTPEVGSAWASPLATVLELTLLAALGRRWLGPRRTLAMLLFLALPPVLIRAGALGNVDHHVHESFLAALAALAFGYALTRRGAPGHEGAAAGVALELRELREGGTIAIVTGEDTRAAVVAGLALGLGRLLTPTSGSVLAPGIALALLVAAALARSPAATLDVARLARTSGLTAAAVLFAGAVLFGVPTSVNLESFSSFHALFTLAALLGAAGLAGLKARQPRWAWALVAALAALAALLPELLRALQQLGRADPMLAIVLESAPLLRHLDWLPGLFGVLTFAFPLAFVAVAVQVARDRELGPLPALGLSAVLLVQALLQARFAQPFAGAAAVLMAQARLPALDSPRVRRVSAAVAVLGLLTFLPWLWPSPARAAPSEELLVRPTLEWIRDHTPAPRDPFDPHERPAYAVLGYFEFGHILNLWAQRAAVGSPFSQAPWHLRANERDAQALMARTDEEAYRLATATGARYVLATPFITFIGHEREEQEGTLAVRLLNTAMLDGEGTGHFRLLFDSPERRQRQAGGTFARVFEVVPGARLTGTGPVGAQVEATLAVRNNLGETLPYVRRTRVGADGRFALTVAYPTDAGYRVTLDGQVVAAALPVSEAQVSTGGEVVLGPATTKL